MKKKMGVILCAVLVCTLLAGCATAEESKVLQEIEQITQSQTEEPVDERPESKENDEQNEYPRGGLIAEQSFELNLEPIGEVFFASYMPDDSENPLADVVFLIEQDGEILSQLPSVTENNVNTEMFHQVEAVNFSDYNYDGCDDIILVISYYLGAGPDAAKPHSTIRYYTGSENGAFIYEKQMSEDATSALAEITIQSAKDFIGYEGPIRETAKPELHPLYEAFLKNEISVSNPYVEGDKLTVMTDEEYESTFDNAEKRYALVDVSMDEFPELIFEINEYPSELMFVLGIYEDELICFDVMETHSIHIASGVYDYGLVWKGQNYDGDEMTLYSYTADGKPVEVRHFTEADADDRAAYVGEQPEWYEWNEFDAD